MKFEITQDNKPYLEARGKIVLNACPGSGKTTAVAYKLTELKKKCETRYGFYAGIACLSFTNVAKNEIGEKYHSILGNRLDYPNIISTIDSFVNQYITLPFYHLIDWPAKRPVIMNSVTFLNDMNLGWFPNKRGQPMKVSYPPSQLKIEIDGSYTNAGTKPNPAIVDLDMFEKYAEKFKKWQLTNGFLNNDDSTYVAYNLLKKYPEIGKSLVHRFPYIIIDEAQDTCEIQYKIFDLLVAAGLKNLEYVGDPYQSLYEFREARPDLFIARFNDIANWTALRLNDCRRSSQYIIDTYSLFRIGSDTPIVSTCKHLSNHKLKVIKYDETNLSSLISKYEDLIDKSQTNYILVRGSTHLEQFGVKPSSEEPWKNGLAKTLLDAEFDYSKGNTKDCIDTLRSFLTEVELPNSDYLAKKLYSQKLKENVDINIKLFDFIREMPSIDDTLANWTLKITTYIKAKFGIEVDLQLKQKGKAFCSLNLKDLLYPKLIIPYPITTIHKVKGMTFSSIMLILSDNSSGEKISLTDFVRPTVEPSPKQRMLYVALSRPEVLCCLAIPVKFSNSDIIKYLGSNIDFI